MPRMGDSRDSSTNVDMAVGTIVWVRRRNGSWWPGRIISDAELSTANLLSPRSGTPVKLLGREDGSVDWYNIEKSRRVKAFRCGDFEESIDKAKAGAGLPTKKREKYARREDAILHALELEKQQLESGFVETSSYRANHEGERELSTAVGAAAPPRARRKRRAAKAASSSIEEDDEDEEEEEEESIDSQIYADDDSGEPSSSGRGQDEPEWDPEDEEVELPRMRGLQDFGLKTAAARNQHARSHTGKPLNGTRMAYFTPRKKRTGPPVDEGSLRKRRKPVAQVLETKFEADNDSEFMDLVDDGTLMQGNPIGLESMGLEFTTTPPASSFSCSSRDASTECCGADMTGARVNDMFSRWENGYTRTFWFDVPVQEQKSAQKETVPMVLLASRLTKKPVVGYPIVIEAVETGFRQQQLVGGWRTARRTTRHRGPRQCPDASNKDEEEIQREEHEQQQHEHQQEEFSSALAKQVVKKAPSSGSIKKKANGNSNSRHKETLSKKLLKKVVQSSRKTRMLSSISSYEQQPQLQSWNGDLDFEEDDADAAADYLGAADAAFSTKHQQQATSWPVETCVPVRVALSRIKAAVDWMT